MALLLAVQPLSSQLPTFYPDDPIAADDDMSLDASKVAAVEDSNGYDFVVNTFAAPGIRHNIRARNVNTVDEVPDSSWFVNRIGRRALSTAELVRGPDRFESISLNGWIVSGGKSSGLQPGFRMTDPSGHLYQIEFDPPSNPEMATGAEVIGTAFYHAFGYNTVDVYVAELDPAAIEISPKARILDPLIGERRQMTRRDVDEVLRRVARMPNGRYRVLASRFAEGAPLGNFRYYGTRPDDPNDIVPHEDRRELRAARVFGAWLNHDDSRGVNSLDMLQTDGNRRYVKHYMFDFGSIMGSGTVFAQRHRAGNEYIVEWAPGWLTLGTLGLYTRDWLHIDYPDVPASVGRFEASALDPDEVAARISQCRVRQHARGRCVLGCADHLEIPRRGCARHRREGAIFRPARNGLHHWDAHRAAQPGSEDVAHGGESGGGFRAQRRRPTHVQQCGSRRGRREPTNQLSRTLEPFRQRDRLRQLAQWKSARARLARSLRKRYSPEHSSFRLTSRQCTRNSTCGALR